MLSITRPRGGARVGAGGGDDGRDAIDCELSTLLRKLSKIEEQIGTKRDSAVGRAQTGDKVADSRENILEQLRLVQSWMGESAKGKSAREQIEADAKIKRGLRLCEDEWLELQSAAKSGDSREVALSLRREIDDVRDRHRASYARDDAQRVALLSSSRNEGFGVMRPGKLSVDPRGEQEEVSAEQQLRLEQIQRRDRTFDATIEQIGRGVDVLEDIARAQNEEVKKQAVMTEDLQQRMDNVQDHLENINVKMKTTLTKVGRSSDKLCVDLMCLMLLIGMLIVLYKLFTSSS